MINSSKQGDSIEFNSSNLNDLESFVEPIKQKMFNFSSNSEYQ